MFKRLLKMDVFPKWIIEQDSLIIRKCTFHKQIAENTDDVKGGGWFYYLPEQNAFLLYSTSDQFGRVTREQVLDCIAKNQVGRFIGCDRYLKHKIFFSTEYKLEDALKNYEYLNEEN